MLWCLCTASAYCGMLVAVVLIAIRTQISTEFRMVLAMHVLKYCSITTILTGTFQGSFNTCEISSIIEA